jgi:hypothetical protein
LGDAAAVPAVQAALPNKTIIAARDLTAGEILALLV